jgi:hypothetical protein
MHKLLFQFFIFLNAILEIQVYVYPCPTWYFRIGDTVMSRNQSNATKKKSTPTPTHGHIYLETIFRIYPLYIDTEDHG